MAKAERRERACVMCGRMFVPRDGRVLTCGAECSAKRHNIVRSAKRRDAREKAGLLGRRVAVLKKVGVCKVCGRPVEAFRTTRRYCDSERCRWIGVIMSRQRCTVAEAIKEAERLERLRDAAIPRNGGKPRPTAKSPRACAYFGKPVPVNPNMMRMSRECMEDGLLDVCRFKGRCPLGRKF